jgi:EAL domain-containing protein (putative c-di-GMP-specific phosphodiesterase class I)
MAREDPWLCRAASLPARRTSGPASAPLDAALLGLELPESTLQDPDEDTQETLRQLHAAGVSLMLDDDPEGVAVVESVIALGRSFGLSVRAEGV